MFKPPERKSLLGLDVLANTKREGSRDEGAFRVPRERVASVAASIDEDEEKSNSSGLDEVGNVVSNGARNYANRRYRESASTLESNSESAVTEEHQLSETLTQRHKNKYIQVPSASTGSSRSRSPSFDNADHYRSRSKYKEDYRSSNREMGRSGTYRDKWTPRESSRGYGKEHSGNYERKRSRYDSSRRTPGRSNWDDGRWEWEDTPRRDDRVSSSRHHEPSRSPMLVGASPDARLVSPWLGGRTPNSDGGAASPWDSIAPSPTPIQASGASVRSSSSRCGGKFNNATFSGEKLPSSEDGEDGPY